MIILFFIDDLDENISSVKKIFGNKIMCYKFTS